MKSIFLTKIGRIEILKRDNYTCQFKDCGFCFNRRLKSKYLHIHHKDFNPLNNNPENLITYCFHTHLSKFHSVDSYLKRFGVGR